MKPDRRGHFCCKMLRVTLRTAKLRAITSLYYHSKSKFFKANPIKSTTNITRTFSLPHQIRCYTTDESSFTLPETLLPKLTSLTVRHATISQTLSNSLDSLSQKEFATLSRELADLQPITDAYNEWKQLKVELNEVNKILTAEDPEMVQLAQDEMEAVKLRLGELGRIILDALLPRDEADDGSAILEIRAGTGGDEATLFVTDILTMYERLCSRHNWKWEVLSRGEGGVGGGLKDITVNITGKGVYRFLKHESGVHRVQRVPITETQGRIHTSTVTVAILPLPSQGEYSSETSFNENEIKVDVYRSSGAGGQHVNTTDSAVRITHLPTGLVVAMQDERSQHKNKAKALKILAAKLYSNERERLANERRLSRNALIGSASRSEKIRTYNYPQNRITDHRTKMSISELGTAMEDGEIDVLIEACKNLEREELLKALEI